MPNFLKKNEKTQINIFQRSHKDSQQAHGKMLNIAIHQRNATKNHNKKPPPICQNGYHQKDNKQQILLSM